MKLTKQWERSAALACLVAALSACGGGGGGGGSKTPDTPVDPLNAADGLGDYGETPGTTKLGAAAVTGGHASDGVYHGLSGALDDAGRAVVVWRVDAASISTGQAAWAQSDAAGTWGAVQPLPQSSNIALYGMALRMNASGDAVLGWVDGGDGNTVPQSRRALRYTVGFGWESTIRNLSGGSADSTFGHALDWDLALLTDGRIITEVAPSGAAASLLSIDTYGIQSTVLTATTEADRTAFAFRADGNGYRYTLQDSSTTSGSLDLVFQRASVQSGLLGPLPIATYGGLCNYPSWYSAPPVTAMTASPTHSAVAVLVQEFNGCATHHNLQLLAVSDASSIRAEAMQANTFGTWIPVPPALAMDSAGNTVAVWKEGTGNPSIYSSQAGNTYRLMWSQALAGQPWSPPQVLIPNLATLGTIPHDGRIAISMNASGQAVAALVLNDLEGTSINASIVLSQFNFTTGWAGWRKVANKPNLSDPSVSINASGQAMLAYTGVEGRRVGGKAPNGGTSLPFGSAPPVYAYAWRF